MSTIAFPPQIGFVGRLSEIADRLLKKYPFPHWHSNAQRYLLRETNDRRLVYVDHSRIQFQMLGFAQWHERTDDHTDIVKSVLAGYELDEIRQFRLNVQGFVDVKMKFSEIADLVYGTYLVSKNHLDGICKPNDANVIIIGERDGMELTLQVAPMNPAQVDETFLTTPNLESFAEPKLLDTGIKELKDKLAKDCFYVNVTLTKESPSLSEIKRVVESATRTAEAIADQAVAKLKSLVK